ncbi:telomere length regulation protein [Saxophila tyrrhenica]|uniref:Small ribosomal subunit protein mS41 n=1 Tax=Saxophila tyrrhenica TaxID=1690608 RepID=A0AAV9NWU6_9PEZI|nr:telomere length regulation protein [Saxophila tyrrhenica]
MALKRPLAFLNLPTPLRTTTCSQCRHLHRLNAPTLRIPKPTPFVPDVQTFLTLIGRGLSQHASKIPSWDALFNLSSDQLKESGVEPPRARRYLLWWRERFRNGIIGIGGDLDHVRDGTAELRIVEVPSERPFDRIATLTKDPGMRKMIVNTPPSLPTNEVPTKTEEEGGEKAETSAVRSASPPPKIDPADARAVIGVKIFHGNAIGGRGVQPVKGNRGLAVLKVQEGLWENRQGRKVDGGERRKAEGDGILQAKRDIRYIDDFDEALGLRELRAKIVHKAGILWPELHTTSASWRNAMPARVTANSTMPLRLSVYAELCYGSGSVEIVRRWLEGGALERLVTAWVRDQPNPTPEVRYRFHVLLACVMSVGCKLSQDMIELTEMIFAPDVEGMVRRIDANWCHKALALAQLKYAYNRYAPPKPVKYRNEKPLETAARWTIPPTYKGRDLLLPDMGPTRVWTKTYGFVRLLKIRTSNKTTLAETVLPPSDQALRLLPVFPNDTCAACGRIKKTDGGALLVCGRCGDR